MHLPPSQHYDSKIHKMAFATAIATINCIHVVLILNINEMSLLYRLATVWSQKLRYQRVTTIPHSTRSSTNTQMQ